MTSMLTYYCLFCGLVDSPPSYEEVFGGNAKHICDKCQRAMQGGERHRIVVRRMCGPHTVPRHSQSLRCCLRVVHHGSLSYVSSST